MTLTDSSASDYCQSAIAEACRLCHNRSSYRFTKRILDSYSVGYYHCSNCNSLQTVYPFWISEAYSDSNLTSKDFGVLQRNLDNFCFCFIVSYVLDVKAFVDYGGGDGLLCRLLRDYSVNAYVSDKYAFPKYAAKYSVTDLSGFDSVCAFEVVEHFVQPSEEFDKLFGGSPRYIFVSTCIYRNQGAEWWYLSADTGQHVFFYSKDSLEFVAKKHGYFIFFVSEYVIFSKDKISSFHRLIMKGIFQSKFRRVIRLLFAALRAKGVSYDEETSKTNGNRC